MTTITSFDELDLPPKLLQALARNKFTTPTPVQAQTIPTALKGHDILGSAQTGTGKTGAFGIPVIAGLMKDPEAVALIMTPTRELAGQVVKALEPMIPTADIRTALLIGGDAMHKQLRQLDHKPRLIVGTPGRINDHLERGSLKLGNVKFLVLDETDRMLDMGFGIQIERILKHVSNDRQTLLFSATLPSNISKLSAKYMRDPIRIAVGSTTAAHIKIKQEVIPVSDTGKYAVLLEQLEARKGSVIIFVKTKFGTEKLAKRLNADEHRSDAIHGDLQQRRRERVIQNFRDKKYRVLVATDVAARGLDIPHIAHVINYDMPQAPEDYIHRIGRTARAGAEGEAVSFLTGADTGKWRAIQRLMDGDDSPAPRGGGGGARRGGPPRNAGGKRPYWKKDGDSSSPRAERSFDKPRGERSFSDKPRGDKPFGDKKPWGDKKPYGDKKFDSDKPRGERSFSDKPREDRPREDKPREDRPRSDKPFGDRKPYGDKKPFGDRKPYGDKKFDSDKPRGERSFGDKPRGERPFGDKPRDDKPRGERAAGEGRKEWSPESRVRSDRPFGDRPAHGGHKSDRLKGKRSDQPQEGGKPFGDKERKFAEKRFGEKKFAGKSSGGKPFGDKKFGAKKFGKPSGAGSFARKPARD
jgi:ATP-dependent RNA helicase DeaD